MMRANNIRKNNGIKSVFLAAALTVALLLSALAVVLVKPAAAIAESTPNSITIHVYDPTQSYDKIGAWLWMRGGEGTDGVRRDPVNGEPFSKTYEDNGQTVTNNACTFTLSLTAAQIESLKGGTELGLLICLVKGTTGDFDDKYTKETSDIYINISSAFDENNHADIYYVRKDSVAYLDLEEAKLSLEKISSARFTEKTQSAATVQFEVTTPLANNIKAHLYNGDKELASSSITIDASNRCLGTAVFNGITFDYTVDYTLLVDGIVSPRSVSKMAFIDDAEFIRTFESEDTQAQTLGLSFGEYGEQIFRVWAPLASSVELRIYDGENDELPSMRRLMEHHIPEGGSWGGVWELTVYGANQGKYYTYAVNNSGVETETIDPYAKACGTNGRRGAIVDLTTTNPVGWEQDKTWYNKPQNRTSVDTPIIWEVAVSDFSSSADSGMKYKGKYLAFTETGTTVPGTNLKTGVDYLKDLGITYVHLNPVYDFTTVDEGDMTRADGGSFNWGYDPQNYNIPEGSYSTDPSNGATRIKEFKRMVKALHDAGIGVIMDVVYNHTYSTGGQALHDTVPYYYHRTDEFGGFTDGAGCGNETASERTMMRKYIVESVRYWAEEYHIDGFRFDLMGLHDIKTLNAVRAELDSLSGGERLLMYGEPWGGYTCYETPSYQKRVAATQDLSLGKYANNGGNKLMFQVFGAAGGDENAMNVLNERVAVFNGNGRDGLRGECKDRTPFAGWVNGAPGNLGKVRRMVEGGVGGYAEGTMVGVPSRNVAYGAAHDNYTLWDHIRGAKHGNQTALFYDDPWAEDVARCKLVSSACLMSTGISFMLAGEEMGRTKYGNENSYNSPVKLNQIVWSRQQTFSGLYDHYKKLIALRKQYSAQLFSYKKSTVKDFAYGSFGTANYDTGEFTFTRTQNGATLTMTLNPSTLTGSVRIGSTTITISK